MGGDVSDARAHTEGAMHENAGRLAVRSTRRVGKCGHNLLIYIRGLGAIHAIIERHVRSHAVGDGGDTRSHANDINDSEP